MAQYTLHTTETTDEDGRAQLEAVKRDVGILPNLARVMAEAPTLLEGYRLLGRIFDKTDLTESERQIILMTNNRLNGCHYCMAVHSTIAQQKSVPAEVIDALRGGSPIDDPKLEALRVFAEKLNRSRGWVNDADIERFLAAGYTQKTVLEVILGTGLKVLSNYTNHVTDTPLDEIFAHNVWAASSDEETGQFKRHSMNAE